jgi:hypothetical protein
VSDWFASGGGDNDSYIWQQVRYAKNYIAAMDKVCLFEKPAEKQQKEKP